MVVVCPGGVRTGGPEALHQLVDMANSISPGDAAICYYEPNAWPSRGWRRIRRGSKRGFTGIFETPEQYRCYNCPTIARPDIPDDALVVVPEISTHLITEFTQPCALWWLSVDNFFEWSGAIQLAKKAELQLTQSEYARAFLLDNYGMNSMGLSDYVGQIFHQDLQPIPPRTNRVAVNPAKGFELIREFRRRNDSIDIVEIANMTTVQVHDELSRAAVYVDFGSHPGKDRLPREAALSGAVVFTARRGAAANAQDVPIDPWYKFTSLDELAPKVREVFGNYEWHRNAQRGYVDAIRGESEVFRQEVGRLLGVAAGYLRETEPPAGR